MISPCIGICSIRGGICRGCGRTPEEIQGWLGMTDDERNEAMRRLKMRRDIEPCIEDQLCARIDELSAEKEALADQLDEREREVARLSSDNRAAVQRIRDMERKMAQIKEGV